MRTRILPTILIAAAALFLSGSAFAQPWSFYGQPSGNDKDPVTPGVQPFAQGLWGIWMNYLGGEQWEVLVNATNLPANGGVLNANLVDITVNFNDSAFNVQTVALNTGGTGPYSVTPPVPITDPWQSTAGPNADFADLNGIPPLGLSRIPGTNTFWGAVILDPGGSAKVLNGGVITVDLNDTNSQWTGALNFGVIPEPGSLALILSGLAPLGLGLRRRRAAC